jgi:ssDNA-specific exonuclease RecJ
MYSLSCILYKKIMLTNAIGITYHQDMLNLIKALHPLTIKMAKIFMDLVIESKLR